MCTAITFSAKDHYFGRNLDLEYRLNEAVTVTPQNFPLKYRFLKTENKHYAFIGMATIKDNYPLYYDAVNEKGLAMAGLNFVGNAHYNKPQNDALNIATFELIPFILSNCEDIPMARELLSKINLTDTPFDEELGIGYLHWMLADKNTAITVEPTKEGLKIYDNPVGVLTNNPPFEYHLNNLLQYRHLSPTDPENNRDLSISSEFLSHGLGLVGLPGDNSSVSRFVRAAVSKTYAESYKTEEESVTQFFHILQSVFQIKGLTRFDGKLEKTVYSSCMNLQKGIYYYKTYENSRISKIDMFNTDFRGKCLITYPLITKQSFNEVI